MTTVREIVRLSSEYSLLEALTFSGTSHPYKGCVNRNYDSDDEATYHNMSMQVRAVQDVMNSTLSSVVINSVVTSCRLTPEQIQALDLAYGFALVMSIVAVFAIVFLGAMLRSIGGDFENTEDKGSWLNCIRYSVYVFYVFTFLFHVFWASNHYFSELSQYEGCSYVDSTYGGMKGFAIVMIVFLALPLLYVCVVIIDRLCTRRV